MFIPLSCHCPLHCYFHYNPASLIHFSILTSHHFSHFLITLHFSFPLSCRIFPFPYLGLIPIFMSHFSFLSSYSNYATLPSPSRRIAHLYHVVMTHRILHSHIVSYFSFFMPCRVSIPIFILIL